MISRFYMTASLVPHGDIQPDGFASPETGVFKGFVRD